MYQKCQTANIANHTKIPLTLTNTPTKSFDTVIVDTIYPLSKLYYGNEYVVTMICDMTKYLLAVPRTLYSYF